MSHSNAHCKSHIYLNCSRNTFLDSSIRIYLHGLMRWPRPLSQLTFAPQYITVESISWLIVALESPHVLFYSVTTMSHSAPCLNHIDNSQIFMFDFAARSKNKLYHEVPTTFLSSPQLLLNPITSDDFILSNPQLRLGSWDQSTPPLWNPNSVYISSLWI
jgi:hypothetical protein